MPRWLYVWLLPSQYWNEIIEASSTPTYLLAIYL